MEKKKFTLKLNEASLSDIDKVGGKNASLGEMLKNLSSQGINIPGGFIVTAGAYYEFIEHNKLNSSIKEIIANTDTEELKQLKKCGASIRQLIQQGEFPAAMQNQIITSYNKLSAHYKQENVDVAVRSSATAEDLPDASFAGQQDTYLNISGHDALLTAIRNCFASLFTDRAISYRKGFGYDDFLIGLSVCVQKMVRSDIGASGVAFSLDTESGFKDVVIINGAYGLGEMVVQGAINPDEFTVFKPALSFGYAPIIEKKLGSKEKKMIYGQGKERVKIVIQPQPNARHFALLMPRFYN